MMRRTLQLTELLYLGRCVESVVNAIMATDLVAAQT